MKNTQQGNTSIAIIIAGLLISVAIAAVAVKLDKLGESTLIFSNKLTSLVNQQNNVGVAKPSQARPAGPKYNLGAVNTSYKDDFILGNPDARFTILVYSDFQCPFCGKFYPTLKEFIKNSDNKTNLVIRHYPLEFHQLADDLAIVAECIGREVSPDFYWSFTEFAYKSGQIKDVSILLNSFIQSQNIRNVDINACRDSSAVKLKVTSHFNEAKAVGVTGTPSSVLINNKSKKLKFVMGFKTISQLNQAFTEL